MRRPGPTGQVITTMIPAYDYCGMDRYHGMIWLTLFGLYDRVIHSEEMPVVGINPVVHATEYR